MSGGHFDYRNDSLCRDIYGWGISVNYGEKGFNQSKFARRLNPLEDLVISELVFDVFCLLHSFDWYQSGDTSKETYREDVKRFKEKWLKSLSKSYINEVINDEISRLREELHEAFNLGKEDTTNGKKENRAN